MKQGTLPEYDYDIIIIGGGPAGYTAGIYAARAALKTLLIEGESSVSQITITDMIENYPGIPEGIGGFELMQLFKKQALKFGLEILSKDVTGIKKSSASPVWEVTSSDKVFKTLSIIAATGAMWRSLGVSGESEFAGKGVSYCATCDGPFYRNRDVIVVGGGDTAIQEALFLTHFAKKVVVIHRRDRLRAAGMLQSRAFAEKKIEFVWNSTVSEITGNDFVTGVKVKNIQTGGLSEISADGIFIFVGRLPYTEIFKGLVETDKTGFIVTDENMRTNAQGLFAAGDCRAKLFRQVVTAAGDGANAVNSAELYIDEVKGQTY
ncbi:MAG TPA: thioredoxin-disulfide reductase [Smithellaceae bacterium]|jgi:thioredoxin reductase (NADPH)|nr:thioredoxin-disulfide reductase [Smithellaceae bacterium]HOG82269.1 thioredoxin-disulfide reductase [Smithellaceae bacterium]HOQ42669.1 thioredoxin-disulfide reductase [Smithellaceae bacterium]HPL68271.1 thioredoxin-disulfide reductase [Smithellaceae bacterium]HQP25031.1 thioredoxin-disulfide reductase [Smithellaceae bacterium]